MPPTSAGIRPKGACHVEQNPFTYRRDAGHPSAGHVCAGHGCGGRENKFINLVVHDNNSTGISFWRGAVDAEIHGCLIQSGDRLRVINALDFFGSPVVQAIYEGHPVNVPVPVHEATGNGEFCAFVVFRER